MVVVALGARFSNGLVIKCDVALDLAMEKGELFRDLQHYGVRLGLCLAEFLNEDDIASLLSTAAGASPRYGAAITVVFSSFWPACRSGGSLFRHGTHRQPSSKWSGPQK